MATTQAFPLNWSSIQLVQPPLRFTQFSFVGQYSFDFDRYIITLDDRLLESAPISLTHAGVNVPFDLYFNFALKLPVYECTVGFCFYTDKFSTSGNSTRMNGLDLDILPATIGEFYARNWGTWTQDGKTMGVPFPAAADFDNDGLRAAPNGLDPNDATWDADGDGLSDGFELSPTDAQTDRTIAYRFDPTAADADNDGLCDADELRLRTNPALADTDGDGLSDGEELYHLNCQSGQWEGGWLFTYNVTNTLTTRVNSDPLSYDGDGDGMSDKLEKDLHAANPAAYPFHPRVFNVSPLGFYAISSDFDRYVATGSTLVFSTTLRNNFTTGDRRAQGSILRSSGVVLGNLSQTGVYTLFPNNEVTFVDTVTAVGGSARTAISNSIAAEFLTLDQVATGTPGYQAQIPYALTIDADKPTSSLTSGTHVQAGGFPIIGGLAQDPTSPVARVDVRIVGQTEFTAAEGSHGWAYTWAVPSSEGVRTIQTRATDVVGYVEDPVNSVQVIVDGTPPQIATTQTGNPIVSARRNAAGQWVLTLSGTVNDPLSGGAAGSGVAAVEVEVTPRSSGWHSATVSGGQWQIEYALSNLDSDNNFNGEATGQYTVRVRAADNVNNQTPTNGYLNYPLRVDTTAPRAVLNSLTEEVTTGNAVAITQTLFITRSLVLTGTVTDPGEFAAGVQSAEIAFVPAELLDGLGAPSIDTYGNQTVRSVGPLTVDSPETPDFVGDLDDTSWLTTGGSHLSTDWEVNRGPFAGASFGAAQKFFASWDSQALRLAWSGANWDGDGDLFVYLDTAAGGATTLYNPFATPAAITLPPAMTANFVVWVKDASTAQLYQNNGGAWTLVSTLGSANFRSDAALTVLRLPFSLLGLSNASSLRIVAVASEEGALKLWAASPDKNPLNSERMINPAAATRNLSNYGLTLYHSWASLALGQIPNANLAPDSDLVLTIAANVDAGGAGFLDSDLLDLLQPGQTLDANGDGVADVALPGGVQAASVGNGDSIGYTIQYVNRGSATARGVTLALAGLGGLSVNPTLNLGDVAPGASGTVQVTATVNGAANGVELQAQIRDTAHGVYDWFWFFHPVDTQTPTGVSVATPVQYAGSGKQIVVGEVNDASPLASVTVTVNGVQTTCPIGNGSSTLWSCLADFGDLGAANSVNIQVQVTDIHGNTSAPAIFTVTVDNMPPTVTFDAATVDALADGFLSASEDRLAGLVNDNFEAVSLEYCAVAENGYAECANIDIQPIGSAAGNWSRRIPLGESDGVTQTLRFTGLDGAGNRSTPVTRTFQLDTVAPVVTATLSVEGISGVVSDGGGIGSVRLRVEPPTGAPYWVDATRNGNQWSLVFTNAAAGVYTLYVEAVDRAGNRAAAGPFLFTVTSEGSESVLYLPVVVYEESKEAPTYLPLIRR